MDINDQFAVVVAEAERTQAEWVGKMAMRLASKASVMEVEQVEQVVVPTTETRGASSEVVSVTSSAHKVSSDAIGLSHRANKPPSSTRSRRRWCDWSAPKVPVRSARRLGLWPNVCMGLARLAPNASRPSCTAAWRKGGTGRGSPPKQGEARRWRRSSSRQRKVSWPSWTSPP